MGRWRGRARRGRRRRRRLRCYPIEGGAAELAEARGGVVLAAASPAGRRRPEARCDRRRRCARDETPWVAGTLAIGSRSAAARCRRTVRCEVETAGSAELHVSGVVAAASRTARSIRRRRGRCRRRRAPQRMARSGRPWERRRHGRTRSAADSPAGTDGRSCEGSVEPPAGAASRSQRALHTSIPLHSRRIRGRQRG